MAKALKKRGIDMLNGSIWNKIPLFALPVAATAVLEQLFNAADIAVVGNFTGELKNICVAAVGANSSVINLIVTLFIGVALGVNVVIANAVGRKDEQAVKKAVHTAVLFAIIGGFIVAVLGQFIAEPLLKLLNVPKDVLPYAVLYLRIYLIGMPVILLYNFEAAIYRSIGETKTPLIALAASGVLNIVLNLFFVIVLKMTVNGVAIATVVSNAVSSIILFILLLRTDGNIKISFKELKIYKDALKSILRIGIPAGIQGAVFAISNIVIQSAINSLGTVVMAASSAAFNIEVFSYVILNSFSQTCTTFVGQNYGAGRLDRCKKTMLLCILEGIITVIAVVLSAGKSLIGLFNNDPEVIETGYIRLVLILTAHVFSLAYEVMSGYLRGCGISAAPAIVSMVGVCGFRIIWVNTVFRHSKTFATIMTAYPLSLGLTTVAMLILLMIYRPSKRKRA